MSDRPSPPILITTAAIPQEAGGTSIVVRRLLANLRREEAVLLARAPDKRMSLSDGSLPVPVIRVRWFPLGVRGERFHALASAVPAVIQGVAAARRYGCGAILSVFPNEGSLLTGYWLHRVTGLPLLAYFCDLYLEDRRGTGWEARLARWLQPRVFKAASRILAVNQGMADFYRARHGLDALVVPTCINEPLPGFEPPPAPGSPFRIAYSGNVNDTRVDSLRALVKAIGADAGISLSYFTSQSPGYLKSLGVWPEHATAEFVPDETALVRRLKECDALFLPLTFETVGHSREQMSTCFGIKAYEYFLAQRPILVHCPGDYFLARFFRDGGCGLVVDDPSPGALANGLARLRQDEALRSELVRRGLEAARQFEGGRVVGVLREEVARISVDSGRNQG
jgi:glycosyltransferase involved in cell wall biosynthesis